MVVGNGSVVHCYCESLGDLDDASAKESSSFLKGRSEGSPSNLNCNVFSVNPTICEPRMCSV